jgi:hypothetical protein
MPKEAKTPIIQIESSIDPTEKPSKEPYSHSPTPDDASSLIAYPYFEHQATLPVQSTSPFGISKQMTFASPNKLDLKKSESHDSLLDNDDNTSKSK